MKNRIGVLVLFGLLGGAAACAEGVKDPYDDAVTGTVRSELTGAPVVSLDGVYTGCAGRSGSWSIRVSGASALNHPTLSVVNGDSACILTVTHVNANEQFTAVPPIPLSTAYASAASLFVGPGGETFRGNARLHDATFRSNFSLSLVHSVDPEEDDGLSSFGSWATVTGSVAVSSVAAPDYTLGLTQGAALAVQVDVAKLVVTATGSATLTDGATPGSAYVVDRGTLSVSASYETVASAYDVEVAAGRERTITGANPTIAASEFGLTSVSLSSPVVRTVIVSRMVAGVRGYQLFRTTFSSL